MEVLEAIGKRRSVRSFAQDEIPKEALLEMVEAARVCPSAANKQPLEFVTITDPEKLAGMFSLLKWAAYTQPVGTPAPGHTPTAYILYMVREEHLAGVGPAYDLGAAIMSSILVAQSRGIASCWLKSVNKPKAEALVNAPKGVSLDSVLALGYPDEEPVMVDLETADQGPDAIKYWRDENGVQYVPKRALETVWRKEGY